MHHEVSEFFDRMKQSFGAAFEARRVFEAGSLDVNGSVRRFFPAAKEYVGIDWRPGKGVDVVSLAHEYRGHQDGHFDVAVSTEMLEHDPYYDRSLKRMMALLSRNGILIVTCAGPERHAHRIETAPQPGYYMGPTMGQVLSAIYSQGTFKQARVEDDPDAKDLRFFGWRKR